MRKVYHATSPWRSGGRWTGRAPARARARIGNGNGNGSGDGYGDAYANGDGVPVVWLEDLRARRQRRTFRSASSLPRRCLRESSATPPTICVAVALALAAAALPSTPN